MHKFYSNPASKNLNWKFNWNKISYNTFWHVSIWYGLKIYYSVFKVCLLDFNSQIAQFNHKKTIPHDIFLRPKLINFQFPWLSAFIRWICDRSDLCLNGPRKTQDNWATFVLHFMDRKGNFSRLSLQFVGRITIGPLGNN